ncbi:MAG: hypothetical protein J1F02_11450 [Lachnospiraceae bacterium]|nr:hypothetical protein [Lachnospiraceae bacterium]
MIHEMGHAFGLGDGYGTEDSYTGKHVDRMTENLETCHVNQQKQWENIMLQCYAKTKVKANDIEMMLQSNGTESYMGYDLNGGHYKMSDAIKNGKDENDENEKG